MNRKTAPPEAGKSDQIYGLFFSLFSQIPLAGPFLTELYKWSWPSKFEKALIKWRADITNQGNQTVQSLQTLQAVEEGLNANGSYTRLGDGRLEIASTLEVDHQYDVEVSIVFPAMFLKPPIIQIFHENVEMKLSTVTAYGASFKVLNLGHRGKIKFRYQAFGKWR